MLGDAVYERGTAAEFRDCYSWRPLPRRARAPHSATTSTGPGTPTRRSRTSGSRAAATTPTSSATWHVVVLNSNCRPPAAARDGSPQQRWLAADLAAHPGPLHARVHAPPALQLRACTARTTTLGALWRTLAARGADVVLAGHDHHYERFAPIEGSASFVVGTGGRSHYPVLLAPVASQERHTRLPDVRRPQADAARRTATTGASSRSPARPSATAAREPAADGRASSSPALPGLHRAREGAVLL